MQSFKTGCIVANSEKNRLISGIDVKLVAQWYYQKEDRKMFAARPIKVVIYMQLARSLFINVLFQNLI